MVLGFAVVGTWRRVVALGRGVAQAGERIADATAGLERVAGPPERPLR
jgi:hypothetical protein